MFNKLYAETGQGRAEAAMRDAIAEADTYGLQQVGEWHEAQTKGLAERIVSDVLAERSDHQMQVAPVAGSAAARQAIETRPGL